MNSPIVFLDTETTGLHPGRKIWEIGAVRREIDGSEKELLLQIDPIDISDADPMGLKIGGFFERHFSFASDDYEHPYNLSVVSEKTAAQIIRAFTHGAHIIGAVPNIDTESLDKLLRQNSFLGTWHYHLIDVETLAIGFIKGYKRAVLYNPGIPISDDSRVNFAYDVSLPWKSDELSRAIGVEPPTDEERHTAMGDCKWAMRTYDKVMNK